jgi:hypothetical protein
MVGKVQEVMEVVVVLVDCPCTYYNLDLQENLLRSPCTCDDRDNRIN